jgi:hypothetical protein
MGHKTMQGKEVDMDKLMRQNELMPAIGNMQVNARGDELGAGGKIVRKREEVVADYYDNNPNANLKRAAAAVVEDTPAPAPVTKVSKKSTTSEE